MPGSGMIFIFRSHSISHNCFSSNLLHPEKAHVPINCSCNMINSNCFAPCKMTCECICGISRTLVEPMKTHSPTRCTSSASRAHKVRCIRHSFTKVSNWAAQVQHRVPRNCWNRQRPNDSRPLWSHSPGGCTSKAPMVYVCGASAGSCWPSTVSSITRDLKRTSCLVRSCCHRTPCLNACHMRIRPIASSRSNWNTKICERTIWPAKTATTCANGCEWFELRRSCKTSTKFRRDKWLPSRPR